MTRKHPPHVVALAVALALTLGVAGGCSEDDDPVAPGGGDPGVDGVGSISGEVFATGGSFPLADATVTCAGVTTTTNEDGYFVLTAVPVGEVVVNVSRENIAGTLRVIDLVEGDAIHLASLVLRYFTLQMVDGAAGGAAASSDGNGVVIFPAGSFIDAAGNAYTGEVDVQIMAQVPEDGDFYSAFPGRFTGRQENGTETPLLAYGFVTVELSDQDGDPVGLAPGATVTLQLTLDSGDAATAPETIPVWTLDEANGRWDEAGEATLTGGAYQAEISHLSTWCWALPVEDLCSVSGRVVNDSGQPVVGARIIARSGGLGYGDEVRSGSDGDFNVPAPLNTEVTVQARGGSLASETAQVSVGGDCPAYLVDPLELTVPAYSIALTWGEEPLDLDSHLLIPMTWDADYDLYHIAYYSMGRLGAYPYANLDTDDQNSFGPEIITGTRVYEGRFQYWVHDYSSQDTDVVQASGAVVQLSIGGALYLYEAADVPRQDADPDGWWHVFDIVVEGGSVTVESVMRFEPEFSYDGVFEEMTKAGK